MKIYLYIILLLIISSFFNCNRPLKTSNNRIAYPLSNQDQQEIITDTLGVLRGDIELNPIEGKWYHHEKPFTGYAISYYENKKLKEKTLYIKGTREGKSKKWFPNGFISKTSNYTFNKIEGEVIQWYSNGQKSAQLNYAKNQQHGIQKYWHSNGQLAKQMNYNRGKEEGLQKAWLDNGKIYVNYEVKNGRSFGLKPSILCYGLKEEELENAFKP